MILQFLPLALSLGPPLTHKCKFFLVHPNPTLAISTLPELLSGRRRDIGVHCARIYKRIHYKSTLPNSSPHSPTYISAFEILIPQYLYLYTNESTQQLSGFLFKITVSKLYKNKSTF